MKDLLVALAQSQPDSSGGFSSWFRDLGASQLTMLVPIVAIIAGGILLTLKMIFQHRERIAMIQQGIDPDASRKDAEKPDGNAD